MKQTTLALALACITLVNTFGQQSTFGTLAGKPVDVKTGSGTVLTQLPMAPPKTNGDVYLHSDWMLASLSLVGETEVLEALPIRLDLQTNSFEIQYQGEVKMLPGVRVSHFILHWNDGRKEKYVNGKNYRLNNEPVGGFLKIVEDGKWMLLVQKQLKVLEASYNPALDVGKKDNEYVKDDTSFLSKNNTLYEVELPAKKFCKQFLGHEKTISQFIKEERINLRKGADLIKMLAFLDYNI